MVMVMSRMSALCVLHAVRIRDLAWQHTVALAGMHGALGAGLAGRPALPPADHRRGLRAVLRTLVVQGLAIGLLLHRLHLESRPA